MTAAAMIAGFQDPRRVTDLSTCEFYHSIELPGLGLQVGQWDLRGCIDDYLGHQPLHGRRVVDIGTASGFLSFEMERRGAEVIAFDRVIGDTADAMGLVPFADFEVRFGRTFSRAIAERVDTQQRLQNGFWLAHRLLESRSRLYCNNVYDGLVGVDHVDVSLFGSILLHLRDPLLALHRFAGITREALIITDTLERVEGRVKRLPLLLLRRLPVMLFRPNLRDGNPGTWWWATPKLYRTFLEVLGFSKFTYHEFRAHHVGRQQPSNMFTLVARR